MSQENDQHLASELSCGEIRRVAIARALANEAHSDDLVLEDKRIKLFVDPSSTEYVQGIEIRYVTTEKGSGFSAANPAG